MARWEAEWGLLGKPQRPGPGRGRPPPTRGHSGCAPWSPGWRKWQIRHTRWSHSWLYWWWCCLCMEETGRKKLSAIIVSMKGCDEGSEREFNTQIIRCSCSVIYSKIKYIENVPHFFPRWWQRPPSTLLHHHRHRGWAIQAGITDVNSSTDTLH